MTPAPQTIREQLAAIMHDAGKSYLMINRDDRYNSNSEYADAALAVIRQFLLNNKLPEKFHDADKQISTLYTGYNQGATGQTNAYLEKLS